MNALFRMSAEDVPFIWTMPGRVNNDRRVVSGSCDDLLSVVVSMGLQGRSGLKQEMNDNRDQGRR